MENEDDRVHMLSDALRAVAREDADLAPTRGVETRLLDELRSIARARRRRVAAAGLAVAAVLTLVATMSWRILSSEQTAANLPPATTSSSEMATTFFPLIYSNLPISNAQLVRVQVPRSALASFGLAPIDVPTAAGGSASGTVAADVLVGEDGVARAVRFVNP